MPRCDRGGTGSAHAHTVHIGHHVPPRVVTLGVACCSALEHLPLTLVPLPIFSSATACESDRGMIKRWSGWRGVGPSQCSTPQSRPLMRVSPGGVFPVHASDKPYSDCLVSLWSSTNRAILVGNAFGRLGLQLSSCSGSTETVTCQQASKISI